MCPNMYLNNQIWGEVLLCAHSIPVTDEVLQQLAEQVKRVVVSQY